MVQAKRRQQVISVPENADEFDDDIELLEELIREDMYEKSEKSLYKFFVNFWDTYEAQPLVNSWMIQCIAEHVDAALNRDLRRLIINVAPRSGKSTLTSISAPPYRFITNPEEKFWLVSHSQKLYTQNITYARRILEHPKYKDRWCNKELDEDNYKFSITKDVNRATRLENTEGGYILGGSPTTKALGMGYTVAILDDILDSEQSTSKEAIKGVNNWFTNTFLNRSNDPKTDVIILVMQRLAQNDPTAYVQETYPEQDWFLLNLPAKYEPTRTFVSPIGFNDKRKVKGELLNPIRLPEEFLIQQNKRPLIYNTRYQQNPDATTDDNSLKEEWLQESSLKPLSYSLMIIVWDLNITDNPRSDYTVGLVIGKSEGEYHIIDMWRKQCEIPEQLDAIKYLYKKYPNSVVGIEARANGNAAMSLLNREIPNIYAFEPRLFGGSKEQRFGATLPHFRDKKVYIYNPFSTDSKLEESYDAEEIKKELKGFPLGKHDDIVDCVSYGIAYLSQFGQENTAVISGGKNITFSEEDYKKNRELSKTTIMNMNQEDYTELYIPNRESIQSIDW